MAQKIIKLRMTPHPIRMRFQPKACPALDAGWAPVRVKKTRQNKKTADIITAPSILRLTTPTEAAILAKRMSEVLTLAVTAAFTFPEA